MYIIHFILKIFTVMSLSFVLTKRRVTETKIYRGVCEICRLPRNFKIWRNFSFTTTNREFSIISASLFRNICIVISCATVVQVSLNSSHAIRPVVINNRPDFTI